MPLGYYGSKISLNLTKTPEGYLIAHRVPIARVGWQEYTPSELGIEHSSPLLRVYRSPEEVFHRAAISSFEGKDITDDHPNTGVDPASWSAYSRGHIQNVHRGSTNESSYNDGDMSDKVLADLHFKDANLISKVEPSDGKREVSCGYKYVLHCYDCKKPYKAEGQDSCKCLNPTRFEQRTIRGNHVAIVDAGRAGPSVRIHDSGEILMADQVQVSSTLMDKMFDALFGRMAKDTKEEEKKETKSEDSVTMDKKTFDRMTKMCDEWEKEKEEKSKGKDKKAKDKKEGESIEEEEEKEEEEESEETGDLEPTEILPEHERPFNPIPGADRATLMTIVKSIDRKRLIESGDKVAIDAFNSMLRQARGLPTKKANDGGRYGQIAPIKPKNEPNTKIPVDIGLEYQEKMAALKGSNFASKVG